MMRFGAGQFEAMLRDRFPLLAQQEEVLGDALPILTVDISDYGRDVAMPKSLQHIGVQTAGVATADWSSLSDLRNVVVPYLGEIVDFWETVYRRHSQAIDIFANAAARPYCLLLRSFSAVTEAIETSGARVVVYRNDYRSDANLAETLLAHRAWLNPVTCLHTDDLQLLARIGAGVPAFRVQTNNWQAVLADAVASSGTVILCVSAASPGVAFELDQIQRSGKAAQTVIVHRDKRTPAFAKGKQFAGVFPIDEFVTPLGATGPGNLTEAAERLLRGLASIATKNTVPERLLDLRCRIVDSAAPTDGGHPGRPAGVYVVSAANANAFANFVVGLPGALVSWNMILQRVAKGGQPGISEIRSLEKTLRFTFASAVALGLTSSLAYVIALYATVASLTSATGSEDKQARRDEYVRVIQMAGRLDALTARRPWTAEIEGMRQQMLPSLPVGLAVEP